MSKKSLRFQITVFTTLAMVTAAGVALWTVTHLMNAQKSRVSDDLRIGAIEAGDLVAAAVQGHAKAASLAGTNKYLNAQALNQIVRAYPDFQLAMVTDKNGRVIAVNTSDAEGKDIKTGVILGQEAGNTEWFKQVSALAAGQVFTEDFHNDTFLSAVQGQPVQANGFSQSLWDDKGKLQGVLTFRAGDAWLKAALAPYFATLAQNGIYNPRLTIKNKSQATLVKFGPDSGSERMATGSAIVTGAPSVAAMKWEVHVAFPHNQLFGDIEGTRGFFYILEILLAAIGSGAAYLFGGRLLRTFAQISSRMDEQSEGMNGVAANLANSSTLLSNSVSEQASALQRTVASVDQVSAMIAKNADNAAESQNMSRENLATASKGQQVVSEMITSIEEINRSNGEIMQQIEAGNQEIANIVKVIMEIGDKTKVINDIVFQTKLLSFNASVEAARAGEHGKGFAVVAEEVGNLAAMSGNAAKEISEMLNGSIQKVEGIVKHTADRVEALVSQGRQKVEAGTVTARRCGETLNEIVNNVGRVDQLVSEIATASKEQAQGAAEITKAMNQLDQVIQENAAMAKNTADAAADLRGRSGEVQSALDGLKSVVFGASGQPVIVADEVPAPAPQKQVLSIVKAKLKPAPKAKPAPKNAPVPKAAAAAPAAPRVTAAKPTPVAKVAPKVAPKVAAKVAAKAPAAEAKAPAKSNVFSFRRKDKEKAKAAPAKAQASPAPVKNNKPVTSTKAVANALGVPLADDDRFEEI